MKELILSRRSIRKYTNYKIPRDELVEIIELAQRAPSSRNLQPWRLFVIESDEAKEKLRKSMTLNLLQLETSSHLILVTVDPDKYQWSEKIFTKAYQEGLMPKEVMEKQIQMSKDTKYDPKDPNYINTLFLDAGLFALNFMYAAKIYGYDTCPIAGFNKSTVNDNLGIPKNLIPTLLISIGKADEEGYSSIRLSSDETTKWL